MARWRRLSRSRGSADAQGRCLHDHENKAENDENENDVPEIVVLNKCVYINNIIYTYMNVCTYEYVMSSIISI